MYLLVATIIFACLYFFLAWKKINYGVFFILATLPLYLLRINIWGLPLTWLEIMIVILFAVWLIKNRGAIKFSNYKGLIILFLLSATLAVLISPDKFSALGIWKAYFIEPILFFLVFINSIKTKADWQGVLRSMALALILIAIPALVQALTGWGISNEFWRAEATRRVTSWFAYPNAVGLIMGPLTILFEGLGFHYLNKKKYKEAIFGGLLAGLGLLAICFAKSEGALFGVIGASLFLAIMYPWKLTRYLSVILLVIAFAVPVFSPTALDWIYNKAFFQDLSGQIRIQQWKETTIMLNQGNWLTGVGLSGYQASVAPYHAEGIWIKNNNPYWLYNQRFDEAYRQTIWQPTEIYFYPHNIALNFISEIGLIGFVILCLLIVKFLLNYQRVKSAEARRIYLILIAVLLGIIIHGLVDVPYFKNDLSVLWWVVFGMSAVLVKKPEVV